MSSPLRATQEFLVLIENKQKHSVLETTQAVPLFICNAPLSLLEVRGSFQRAESQIPNQEEGKDPFCP